MLSFKNFAKLKLAINPNDIFAQLYSAKLITTDEKNAACNQHNSTDQRTKTLLNAVEKAIIMNEQYIEY